MNFICPKCRLRLTEVAANTARCSAGHSYDKAKSGYYNLLLNSGKGNHGDNKEMVEARRAFLNTGAYKPLADKVAELCREYAVGDKLLDVGCGEGYYTDILEKSLVDKGIKISAFDISREAVNYAAKRNKNIEFAVASAYRMPTSDSEFDTVVNMFSPLALSETARTLKKGGIFIMAIPGENHLFGLKSIAYENPYKNEVADTALPGFELLDTERLSYLLKLDEPEKIKSLFMMTPYAYRTRKEDAERVMSLRSLQTEIEFHIFVYRKL